jgi:hypothetical protein
MIYLECFDIFVGVLGPAGLLRSVPIAYGETFSVRAVVFIVKRAGFRVEVKISEHFTRVEI